MVLFALVAVLENEKTEEAFVTTQVTELERIQDPELVGEWVYEYSKNQNKELRINTLEYFNEMKYEIYAKKLDSPYVSFYVFVKEGYTKTLALKALQEFEDLYLRRRMGKHDKNVSEDNFETIDGLDRILTKYYEGIENIDKLNDRMNLMVNKAEQNKNKTQDILNMTEKTKYTAQNMTHKANHTRKKADCCRVF